MENQFDTAINTAVGNDVSVLPDDNEQTISSKTKQEKNTPEAAAVQTGSDMLSSFLENFVRNYKQAQKSSIVDKEISVDNLIDWGQAEKFGLSKETLYKCGAMSKMLKGGKSDLVPISVQFDGVKADSQARLSLVQDKKTGKISFKINPMRTSQELEYYFDYKFTDEDRANLRTTGNLGKVIEVEFKNSQGIKTPIFLSLDKQTNELLAMRADKVKIRSSIGGVLLTEEQKAALRQGKAVRIEGLMNTKTGEKFGSSLQFNAADRKFVFVKQGLELVPAQIGGVNLSEEQRHTILRGTAVKLENLKDKAGKTYTAYVRYDTENGKIDVSRHSPAKQRKSTPTLEYKTQTAGNNDGHKPKALEHLQEPLEHKQSIAPTQRQKAKIVQKKNGRHL